MPDFAQRSAGVLFRLVLIVIVGTAVAGMVSALVLPAAVFATDTVETVQRDVFDVPPLPDADRVIENSFIYAADGSEIAEISLNESRLIVPLDDIPEELVNAVVATEDAEFWEHDGINLESIVRAAAGNFVAGEIESGASTITQQYVKNAYIDQDRRTEQTYDRKLQEALWAVQIEDQLSKEEILEDYLNRIPLGDGVYGVGKAAERYFSATLDELTLNQSATIAGMIRSPEGNNPITNPRNARERRDIVLRQMAIQGYISSEQAETEQSQPLATDPTDTAAPDEPWWVDFVTRQLYAQEAADPMGIPQDLLDALGDNQDARVSAVFQSGLRIHTTLDPALQDLAEASIDEFLSYEDEPRTELAREPFGGIVSVAPGDGAIRTMAIGPFEYGECNLGDPELGTDDQGRILCDKTKFNPVVPTESGKTGRQPGSSFKPATIAAALEADFPPGWTADSRSGQRIDGPAGCSEQEPWRPDNFGGGGGNFDMYSGIKNSSNVFHAQLISEVGPSKVVDTATRAGIFASELDAVCSLTLGTEEVFPLEMASFYATLAAEGQYCRPYAISRIETRDGQLLYEHTPDCEQAIQTDIAHRVIDIMRGPVTDGGTAPGLAGALSPHPVRGKTGTTQDYRDAWFVGYVPQMATAAWVGYPNGVTHYDCDLNPDKCAEETNDCFGVNEERNTRGCIETRFLENVTIGGQGYRQVFGGSIPAPMWSRYMQQALEGVEAGSFPDPGPVPRARVPDLSDVGSLSEMRSILEEANLRLFVKSVEDYRPENTFLRQNPAAGSSTQAGRAVTVELSDGTGERPTVPDLVGLERDEAREIAVEGGFSVVVREEPTDVQEDDGLVIGQSLPAGDDYTPENHPTLEIVVGVFTEPQPDDGGGDGDGDGGGGGDGGGNGGGGNGNGGGNNGGDEGDGDGDDD